MFIHQDLTGSEGGLCAIILLVNIIFPWLRDLGYILSKLLHFDEIMKTKICDLCWQN